MKSFCALLLFGFVCFGYWYFHRPITHPPGVLVASDPYQSVLIEGADPIEHGKFRLTPLARFSIEGRVLHRKRYGYDRQAKLSPMDLAVGWGRMSDQAVLDQLKIRQSMRFYWYEYRSSPPIPREEIVRHSTNLHIIPATPEIAAQCKALRPGELVHFEGELVEANGPEIGRWRSSLTRTDEGNGACELLLVQECWRLERENRGSKAMLVRR